MGVYLNPGNNGFKQAINSKIYVDKTALIQYTNESIDTMQRFICISRPRRFGKSMTANMLAAYYGKGYDSSEIFDKYKIAENTTYRKHLNQYNVIFLNVQNAFSRADTIEEMLRYIQREILIELREKYEGLIPENEVILSAALEKLYSNLNEGFIFIIDEWDCVFRNKQISSEEQTKYLDFLRDLLKDKVYVSLAYMTGILPIKKYGTHSALNMFGEYSMTSPKIFAEYIGFTEDEVKVLCSRYQMDFETMKSWYDGYSFPKASHIYNPKSVVDALLSEEFTNYWTQTETYEALREYIDTDYDGLKESIIQMLAGNRCRVNTRTFQNDMTTFRNKDDILTLLIHLGYLAYDSETASVYIPNAEIWEEFKNAVEGSGWSEVITLLKNSEQLLLAMWNGDAEKVAGMIDRVHSENTSILTYNDENSLSCVISLAYYYAMNEYIRVREFPTGKGFADVVYIPRKCSDKPAIIVELKYDKSAEGAIAQIKEKRYVESLKEYQGNMLLVGINYDKMTKKHTCVIERYVKKIE